MAIDNVNIVDLIGTDKKTGDVMLTISDHLDWHDINSHIVIWQEKINSYLRFIESGEIYKSYPNSKKKRIIIEVVCKYELPPEGIDFMEKAKIIMEKATIEIRHSLLNSTP
jgi:hypothetical protein